MNQIKKLFSTTTALIFMALSFSACGSSGSDGAALATGETNEKGEVVISLTDAEGDFENYVVDVQSLTLTKKNGTVVETMPVSSRIDFAEYVDLSEIVTTATIPLGTYTHATMVLDYSTADIQVEVDGLATPARVVDAAGDPITTLEVRVTLDTDRPLVIAPGVPAHLSLDFDLEATNEVDTAVSPPLVVVEPLLIAEVNPNFDRLKIQRMRGPLVEINEREENFKIAIRPFRHKIDRDRGHFGKLKIVPNAETVYEVSGVSAVGSRGFALLAAEPLYTAVVVIGKLNIRERLFEASEVRAGSSVPGGDMDVLHGSVLARDGDRLTVHGAVFERRDGSIKRHKEVIVLLGENTVVTKQGEAADEIRPFTKDDVSVGQRVVVFGTALRDETEALERDRLTLDASEGFVRLKYTTMSGTVNAIRPDAAELVLNLHGLNGHAVGKYDFSGTGSDPAAYVVNTGSLGLHEVLVDDPIRLRGHVAPFGETPPDFFARTVIDVSGVNALMRVSWKPATGTPFLSSSAEGLELDFEGVGRWHHVFRARIATVLEAVPAPQILPGTEGRGRYAIREARTVTVHSDFGTFVRDLNLRLDGGSVLRHLNAKGKYTGRIQSINARLVTVGLR